MRWINEKRKIYTPTTYPSSICHVRNPTYWVCVTLSGSLISKSSGKNNRSSNWKKLQSPIVAIEKRKPRKANIWTPSIGNHPLRYAHPVVLELRTEKENDEKHDILFEGAYLVAKEITVAATGSQSTYRTCRYHSKGDIPICRCGKYSTSLAW